MKSNDTFISIIIATFNAEKYILRAIDSVKRQQFKKFELIIIDGNSKDKTVELVAKNSDIVDFFCTEDDKGIYDAWNKGLKASKGNWIMFLGADDVLLDHALANYAEFIDSNKVTKSLLISAKCRLVNSIGDEIKIFGKQWSWPAFNYNMTIAHPGSLHSRKLFEMFGFFDSDYKITGDYEFLLRAGDKLNALFMNEVVVNMQTGGVSSGLLATREYYKAIRTTGNLNYFVANYFRLSLIIRYKLGILKRKLLNIANNTE